MDDGKLFAFHAKDDDCPEVHAPPALATVSHRNSIHLLDVRFYSFLQCGRTNSLLAA